MQQFDGASEVGIGETRQPRFAVRGGAIGVGGGELCASCDSVVSQCSAKLRLALVQAQHNDSVCVCV